MNAMSYADDEPEVRTFTPRKWLSDNDDKAWGERLYLWYIPFFFLIAGITSKSGLSTSGDWGNLLGGFLVWLPFCVLLPMYLRRDHPLPYRQQWWFKCQLYLAVVIFFLTYFGTEYFFDTLGMRYRYPNQTWYFDSVLLGPDQATAHAQDKRVPLGMYPISIGFFTVYHIGAIVVMRRIYRLGQAMGITAGKIAFMVGLLITAWFWAWLETMVFVNGPKGGYSWYEDLNRQLATGTYLYAIGFFWTFTSLYWLDERPNFRPWNIYRACIEATAMCMGVLLSGDLWSMFFGVPFG